MHRLRLLIVLGFVLTLGASVARGQEGTAAFKDQDQASDQTSKSKPKKAKTKTTSDSHRRHWWSPPSWFHKKHDKAAHNQSGKNPFDKTATVAAPAPNTASSKTGTSTTAKATAPAPPLKTRTGTAATSSTAKTGTGVHTATKAGSTTGTATKGTSRNISSRKKKTTATAGGKKPARQNCSPEEAKKGGCQTDKGSNQKTTASATAHPS